MKIKLNQAIKDPKGEDMKYVDSTETLTLKAVIQDALLFPKEKEDGKEQYVRYDLFKQINEAKNEIELSTDDISSIKKLIGEIKPPLIMGQAWEMLEGIVDPLPKPPPPPPPKG